MKYISAFHVLSYIVVGCFRFGLCNDTKDHTHISAEKVLVKTILEKLTGGQYIRPVLSTNDTVKVRFGLTPINIVSVDAEGSAFVLNSWNSMSWVDESLKWDPQQHDGIKSIRLPSSEIWTPDIHLYNNGGPDESSRADRLVVINSDGEMNWVDELRLTALCEMKILHFPFDSQNCILRFGSWSYSGSEVDIDPQDAQDHFIPHREWSLSVGKPKKNTQKYDCCPGLFVDVTYEFVLKRHSQYFQCVFIAPAISIAFLTPTLFVMDHRDKFTVGAGMMVSLTILMEMLDEQVPGTHYDVPILARYFTGLFGMVCLGLILATITSNMRQKASLGTQPPNFLIQCLVTGLGKLVCVRPSDYRALVRPSILAMKQEGTSLDSGQDEVPFDMSDRQTMVRAPPKSKSHMWTVMAIVVDRVFFLIYTIGLIVFTVSLVIR